MQKKNGSSSNNVNKHHYFSKDNSLIELTQYIEHEVTLHRKNEMITSLDIYFSL